MNWICSRCKRTVATNTGGKPLLAGCIKDKNGKPQHHKWMIKK